MSRKHFRRTILAAAGTLTLGAVGASATEDKCAADHKTVSSCDSCEHSCKESSRVVTDSTSVGTIKIENYSPCTRKVFISVTGEISEDENPLEDGDESMSVHVSGTGRAQVWFTGSIKRLDCEPADLDVLVEQRSVDEAANCDGDGFIRR